jgi:hypothetical protein
MPPIFWTQKQDIGPTARTGHGMAYDAPRQRVVLFGGDSGGGAALADTWHWDGSLWTQVADIGPSARHGHALAANPQAQYSLLFGGTALGAFLADTWTWDTTDWVQVADTGPSARAWHSMAFDAARGSLVLFGGQGANGPLGDTWEWDGMGWTQVQDQGPSPRLAHAMAFDPILGRVILFGGADSNGTGRDDTWAWDGANWTQISNSGPEPRANAALVGTGAVLLFGGVNSVDPNLASSDRHGFGDSWRWDGHVWTKVQDIGPAPRWGHGMAFRGSAVRVTVFGGTSESLSLLADTWEVGDAAQPFQPPAGGPGLQVAMVSVDPPTASNMVGETHQVTVVLTGPAPTAIGLDAQVMYLQQGNPVPINPSGFDIPLMIGVGPLDASTTFTITKDANPLAPGEYAVVVMVGEAGGIPQIGLFAIA